MIRALAALLLLAACGRDVAGWIRTDRRVLDYKRLEIDQTICRGERDRSALITDAGRQGVFEGCMAGRGYLVVRPE